MMEFAANYSPSLVALCLVVTIFLASLVHRVLYNLYQHPLAHIPGPKLAAVTYLYQTYHGLAGGKSRYYIKVSELHKKYGRVRTPNNSKHRSNPYLGDFVRITPDEVHLINPDHYEVIYSVGSKFVKVTQFYGALGAGYSTFTAGSNEVHKPRRARLDPFFSRRNVLKLEYLVQARAEKLLNIMTSKFSRNEAVDLHHAFRSISVDVISD